MPTRLYYTTSAAPISPTPDAGWNDTTGMVRRLADIVQAAATEQVTVSYAVTGPTYTCTVQLVSPPLAAQTISGSVSVVSRGRENTINANVNKRARSVRVVSGDGLTVRGTLNAWAATASTTELSATTLQGQQHASAAAITSVVCQAGDRIVVEVGYGVGTSGTTPQGIMEWGGTGTDHANANSDVTGTVPWVEFSGTITWLSPSSVTLTPAAASFSAPSTTPVPQPVTVALIPATATFTAPAVTPSGGGAASVTLTAATASFTAPAVTGVPQSVTVPLVPATAVFSARPVTATPGPVTAALVSATAVFSARPVTAQPGPVTTTLAPALATFMAPALAPESAAAKPLAHMSQVDRQPTRTSGVDRVPATMYTGPAAQPALAGTDRPAAQMEA